MLLKWESLDEWVEWQKIEYGINMWAVVLV
jgi:hypothetical protein